MKRFSLLFLLLFVLILTAFGRTIYVVSVGICDYKYIKDLRNTENDAKNFSQLYLTHTKNIKTLLGSQATHDNILNTLKESFSKASEDDIVVFFFSGHGGKGGLCAYDTKAANTMVTYKEIQKVMAGCKSDNKHTDKSNSTPLMSDTKGVMLFLSSRTGETSQENIWADNGYFTQYILKGLKGAADVDGNRIITAKEIFNYVSTKVSERTKKKQNPVMWGKFNDNMHIMNWNPKK